MNAQVVLVEFCTSELLTNLARISTEARDFFGKVSALHGERDGEKAAIEAQPPAFVAK